MPWTQGVLHAPCLNNKSTPHAGGARSWLFRGASDVQSSSVTVTLHVITPPPLTADNSALLSLTEQLTQWRRMVGASLYGPASGVLTSWHEDGRWAGLWLVRAVGKRPPIGHRDLAQTRTRGWQSTHTSDKRDTNIIIQGRDGNLNEFMNVI